MALPQNREAVLRLKSELERLIVAPRLWLRREEPCTCGRGCDRPAGRASAIEPGGGRRPGLEAESWSWHVLMEPDSHGERPFTAALHQFVRQPGLDAMFRRHFPLGWQPSPYEPGISPQQRYERRLPAAVSIARDRHGIAFRCDWGREQHVGRAVFELLTSAGPADRGDGKFSDTCGLLRQLLPGACVYAGGPDPDPGHPWEAEWLLNLAEALDEAAAMPYVYLYNQHQSSQGRLTWYTSATVAFSSP